MAAERRLRELGRKLEAAPPAPVDALTDLLEQVLECLYGQEQLTGPSMISSMQPTLKAITREEFLKQEDEDVKVLLAFCFSETLRITASEAPFGEDVLRDIFYLIFAALSGLRDLHSKFYRRRVSMLETCANLRFCVLMLDIECDDLVTTMFRTFLEVGSDNPDEHVAKLMLTIIASTVEESMNREESLVSALLTSLGQRKTGTAVLANKFARNAFEHTAGKLEPYFKKYLISSLTGDVSSSNANVDLHRMIWEMYQCAPKLLDSSGVLDVVVPYITGELQIVLALLKADQVHIRSKAVELLGELVSLPGVSFLEHFRPLFSAFLNRLTDTAVEVRISVIKHLKRCLISNHSQPEAAEITKALSSRLLDHEESVRKEAVAALCDVACHSLCAVSVDIIKAVAEHLHDKSAVKCYTMERLTDIYKVYCLRSFDGLTNSHDLEWIAGKIFRCLFAEGIGNMDSHPLGTFLNYLQRQFSPINQSYPSAPQQFPISGHFHHVGLANRAPLAQSLPITESPSPSEPKGNGDGKRKLIEPTSIIGGKQGISVQSRTVAKHSVTNMKRIQKCTSSRKLQATKRLAVKENKESKMLDTYKELLLANTSELSENAKAEHAMALKCLRLRIFGENA